MPGINAGWANNCGKQLFTIGWVPCDVVQIPPSGGGGGSTGRGPGFQPSPRPSVTKNEPLYLTQALQEDEELLIMIKTFVETIRWH